MLRRIFNRIMRRHDMRIIEGALAWWDFDGSYNTEMPSAGDVEWIQRYEP